MAKVAKQQASRRQDQICEWTGGSNPLTLRLTWTSISMTWVELACSKGYEQVMEAL